MRPRASVRCGRNACSVAAGPAPARRAAAATEAARRASSARSPLSPHQSTRARAAEGNAPAPASASWSGWCRAAARSSREASRPAAGSPISPRKARVTCQSGWPVQRSSGHWPRTGATAASSSPSAAGGGVIATNSLMRSLVAVPARSGAGFRGAAAAQAAACWSASGLGSGGRRTPPRYGARDRSPARMPVPVARDSTTPATMAAMAETSRPRSGSSAGRTARRSSRSAGSRSGPRPGTPACTRP